MKTRKYLVDVFLVDYPCETKRVVRAHDKNQAIKKALHDAKRDYNDNVIVCYGTIWKEHVKTREWTIIQNKLVRV